MAKEGKISESFVKKLQRPESGQHIEWDDKIDGFGVRINAGGSIAFVLNYTLNKKRRRFKIGRYPALSATAARIEAAALRNGIDKDGIDPQDRKVRSDSEPTFKELSDKYLKHAETYKRPGSLRNDRGNIRRLLPQWGEQRLIDFRMRDVEKIHTDLKASPYHANRVLALLSNMFTKAVEWEMCAESPIKRGTVKKLKFPEDIHQRPLSKEEQLRLLKALDKYRDQNASDAIRLLLYTGSRESEVLQADWSQFDLTKNVESWTKPMDIMKGKKAEKVPLSRDALAVLKRIGPKKQGPLFPGATKDSAGVINARVTIRKPWIQICKAAGLVTAVKRQGKKRIITRYKPVVRVHDLRHTFASDLVSKGVSLYLVGKLLGHRNPSTTQRYAHATQDALRAAANQFGEKQ